MEKIINSYETLFVISPELSEEDTKSLIEKFTGLIAENGELGEVAEWGRRRLAYPIDYKTEGYYVLMNYKSEPSFPLEMERVLGITDGILRHMTTTSVGSVAPVVEAAPAEKVEEAPVVSEETATDAE